ncbi:preprotein translocase subunit YajC [Chromobacterium subtsugae]|uniref:Sec translocon accessory complex subunit YajC n=1 Tax=Chromobacterium subtsugae TaxID=251747 RepID=A0ABS7FAD9_9NEIS|nr:MULTISPECIES: preprotein translocase subunit YajC [Chromobacterium]KUM02530.1 preprotein translocase subunit YajC [Chromobacterium subtsugae]KZE87915.1 preprotein translocase subunit YajC [Chromobacterium sp. F49]MBW7565408.1 preprotein translocase subunit YajC [Chromobacterium subtsugae]MBW8286741.1 preprotein translocase subunit YajC [Chromobacterium subtsugae]OBU85281.1 preprotein translocase subunit YajC [Chromobacterium subtsugae]
MFISPAFAAGSGSPAGFDLMGFLPMIVIFVLFWFLMVRPQQKRMKETQKMLSEIQKGDEVVTQGGIVGRVAKTSEQYLTLEIANGVEITVQRGAVSAKLEKGTMKSL